MHKKPMIPFFFKKTKVEVSLLRQIPVIVFNIDLII